ncbi:polysaccharide (de)acetylase [Flavobacterium sp.]|uniref:polysaccharide (de)acetylase n=1 Tax=Flavobacterium sp. TaxID=239 RepID=UPI00404781B3
MVKQLLNTFYNSLGWKTKRKLVLILSDDWGSIRVPSKEARAKLIASGINMETNRFNKYDSLESNTDVENLFEVLLHHKDGNGNHPVFTALTNVANPDFNKINNNDFNAYFYEPFTESLKKYPNCDKVYGYYKSGIENKIFMPEFHGREHLNVNRWMKALQNDSKITRLGFENAFYMIDTRQLDFELGKSFGPAFDTDADDDIINHKEIVREGLDLFQDLFEYRATLFTAPSQIYDERIESTLKECGIAFLDVPRLEKKVRGNMLTKTKINYIGKTNKYGQNYLIRNAAFEPNLEESYATVDGCLHSIALAFQHNKPAIISNHRTVFTGSIDPMNREKGLKDFDALLSQILKKWPDAEFITVAELYNLMNVS